MSSEEEEVDDLFGEEGGDQRASREASIISDNEDGSDVEDRGRSDSQQAQIAQKTLDMTIPKYAQGRKPGAVTAYVRVPQYLAIEPRRFDEEQFLEEVDSKGEQNPLAESTIRWKYTRRAGSESGIQRISNSRFIKWSDGSLSLQLGSEIFDVGESKLDDSFLAASMNPILMTATTLTKTMNLTPTSMASLTHKQLSGQLAKQQKKSAHVGAFTTLDDPEKVQREVERVEKMKWSARRKLERKREQELEEMGATGRGSRGGSERAERAEPSEIEVGGGDYEEDDFVVGDDDLEESDEEEAEARAKRLNDLKKQGSDHYKRRAHDEDDEHDGLPSEEEEAQMTDEGSSDETEEREVGSDKKKRRIIDDDDDE